MSIVRKVFVGYLVLAILFLVFAMAFGIGTLFVSDEAQKTHDRTMEAVQKTQVVQARIVDATWQFRLAAATGAGGVSAADAANRARAIKPALDELEAALWDDASRKQAESVRADLDAFATEVDAVARSFKAGDSPAAISVQAAQTAGTAGEAQAAATKLTVQIQAAAASRDAAVKSRQQKYVTAMQFGFTTSAILAFGLAFFLPRSIKRRLTVVVNDLAGAAAETLSVASQVAAGALQTSTSVSEAATTIDEVRQTSLLASQKATDVATSSRSADKAADGGREAVAVAAERMQGIHDQMGTLATSVVSLSEHAVAAHEIVTTIRDLAEQSNLLSVNAAIEAAKASEQGKGFSVVAEEIKILAAESKTGTEQVRSVLADIQQATGGAVTAAENSSNAIEAGLSESTQLRDAIETLADSVSLAAQSAAQIEASTQQQIVGMDQISEAMTSIDNASAQNAAGARQLEIQAEHLQTLASSLERLLTHGGHTEAPADAQSETASEGETDPG